MASVLARRAAGLRPQVLSLQRSGCSHRTLHVTSIVQKKKSKVVVEDLFPEDGPVEDLIKAEPTSSSSAVASTSTPEATPTRSKTKTKLTPEARQEHFQQILDFVIPRIGKKPTEQLPKVRNSAWVHLVGLATTEEQLAKVAELFPKWIEGGRKFDDAFSELFVRRCGELQCPDLALHVFGNYGKYNLHLTLPGARQLLHSLHQTHPIEKVVTASALYSVYSLPPVAKDLTSCAMMISACYRHNTKASLDVARALLPSLQQLLADTTPVKEEGVSEKSQRWLKWSLKKVDKSLFEKTGTRADWLSVWRAQSGHIADASQF